MLAHQIEDLCHGVLEERRGHARCANAADLLFVHQNAYRCTCRIFDGKLSHQARISADAVVLAIANHHRAIEPAIARVARGNHLDLSRKEIFLFDAVALQKQLHDMRAYRFLLRSARDLLFVGLFFFGWLCFGGFFSVFNDERFAPKQNVEAFAFHHFPAILLHLLCAQMRQQIGHAEDRVGWIVAQRNIDHGAILLGHYAFECERQRDPLIVLDAAVIVGIEQHKIRSFVKRILLQVETRGIDMRA